MLQMFSIKEHDTRIKTCTCKNEDYFNTFNLFDSTTTSNLSRCWEKVLIKFFVLFKLNLLSIKILETYNVIVSANMHKQMD